MEERILNHVEDTKNTIKLAKTQKGYSWTITVHWSVGESETEAMKLLDKLNLKLRLKYGEGTTTKQGEEDGD
jgi:hypothetical protein